MSRIAYLRVSTDAQSLARQEAYVLTISPDKIYREKLSGKDANRPELQAMLAYVREGDTVYVESISRLARSTADLLSIVKTLTDKGVDFVSQKETIDTTTPQGRFMLTIFAALAELERENTLQRTREGIAAAKASGKRFGRPPVCKPPQFARLAAMQRAGQISAEEAAKQMGIGRSSFYKLLAE